MWSLYSETSDKGHSERGQIIGAGSRVAMGARAPPQIFFEEGAQGEGGGGGGGTIMHAVRKCT